MHLMRFSWFFIKDMMQFLRAGMEKNFKHSLIQEAIKPHSVIKLSSTEA